MDLIISVLSTTVSTPPYNNPRNLIPCADVSVSCCAVATLCTVMPAGPQLLGDCS